MSLLEEITPAPRKVMTLFYVVDTSGSMAGTKIGTVNAAMENCIPLLKEVAVANDDTKRFCLLFNAVGARVGLQQIMILQVLVNIED